MAKVTIGGRAYQVELRGQTVVVDGHEYPVKLREDNGYTTVTAGTVPYRVNLPPAEGRHGSIQVLIDYRPFTLEVEGRLGGGPPPREPRAIAAAPAPRAGVKGGVAAQIAGRIISVKVKPGQAIAQGDVLLLLEAMKMENEVKAPAGGTIKEILVADGDRVSEGQTLIVIE
jgi:biotin carboxyl carrier protein